MKPTEIELIEDFLAECTISRLSKRQYLFNLKRYYRYLRDEGVDYLRVQRRFINKYIESLENQHKSTLTVASYLQTVKLMSRWLKANNYIDVDTAAEIRVNKEYDEWRKSSLTEQQISKLLAVIDQRTIKGKRNYAIITLMLHTGIRVIEVSRLLIDDVRTNDTRGPIIMVQRKGRHTKKPIPVSQQAIDCIENYLLSRDEFADNDPLFAAHSRNRLRNQPLSTGNISKQIKKYLIEIGLPGNMYTAHSLRHSAARVVLNLDLKDSDLQHFLGHARFTTSQIYTRQQEQSQLMQKRITDRVAERLTPSIL